jgi:hypothetical protein
MIDKIATEKDLKWKIKQVSTHGHDRVTIAEPILPSWKPFAKKGLKHRDNMPIPPNNSYEFPVIEGPGKIVNIWLTISPYNLRKALKYYTQWEVRKKVTIQVFFDDEKNPSIDSPLGDFFGVGFGRYGIGKNRDFRSQFLEETSGGYICRFPMPFKKKARIVISNTHDEKEVRAFYGAITYMQYVDGYNIENPLYFNTKYREERPTELQIPYKVLDIKGRGLFVGFVLNQENIRRRNGLTFLEGNTKYYIDGEKEPSLEYTGTEDIFQGGWYYMNGAFHAPYSGCTVHTYKKLGLIPLIRSYFKKHKISQYRFHSYDAIPFEKSFLGFIHHGEFDEIMTNQSSVSYFYAQKPVKCNWDSLKHEQFVNEYYPEEKW